MPKNDPNNTKKPPVVVSAWPKNLPGGTSKEIRKTVKKMKAKVKKDVAMLKRLGFLS